MTTWINLGALWKILVFGLIAGAGLPALFAAGMLSLYRGQPRTVTAGGPSGTPLVNTLGAAICFLTVLAAIGWGVYEIYQLGHPHH